MKKNLKNIPIKIFNFYSISVGPIKPEKEAPATLEELEKELDAAGFLPIADGQWHPLNCRARDRVAIIIPYRDRAHHLNIFLKNIHPFLQRQQLDYGIFVIEQAGKLFLMHLNLSFY